MSESQYLLATLSLVRNPGVIGTALVSINSASEEALKLAESGGVSLTAAGFH